MLTISSVANLIKDFEISDMFKTYLKLAEEGIIHVAEEDYCVTFYYSEFLRFVHKLHFNDYKELTKSSHASEIWFCAFYYAEEYELHFAMWINENGVSFGGGGDGATRCLSSPRDCDLLKAEMKKHLNILLAFKSLFYDEYRSCKIP